MKIQGQHSFDAPRAVVWRALLDPRVLARTLPGCEELKEEGENRLAGALNIRVGPVAGRFTGTVTLSELVPPESYRLALEGTGAQGFVRGEGRLELEDAEGGGTTLRYDLDAQVGGRVAGVGQRLLDSSARVLTRQALEGLERQLPGLMAAPASESASDAAPEPAAEVAPPSQVEFASRFAGGLLAELVPRPWRPVVVAAALALLALLVFLLIRSCG